MLHIVNGDCAIEALKDSGIEGDFLSWLDVLHDGPVPEGLSLEELSEVRTDFIADCDWAVPVSYTHLTLPTIYSV